MVRKSIKKKNYKLDGFGFPVILAEVELIAKGDDYFPLIDSRKVQDLVFDALRQSHCQLMGSQLSFVRKYMDMTQHDLAKALGLAGHTTISQWESAKSRVPKGFDSLYLATLRALMAKYRGLLALDLGEFTRSISDDLEPPQAVIAISA